MNEGRVWNVVIEKGDKQNRKEEMSDNTMREVGLWSLGRVCGLVVKRENQCEGR